MALVLEQGNPHLRIVDHLTNILNKSQGLDGVATILKLTLPVVRGLDAIEVAWTPAAISEKGEVFMNVRASDWYIIRYNLNQASTQSNPLQLKTRKVMFEVRLRQRRGEPWWHVRRTDNSRNKEPDDLDEALKPLWASSGIGWRGMRISGVAQGDGAEDLLVKIDEAVRNFAIEGKIAIADPKPTQVPTSNPARQNRGPGQQQQQQQQRQQHTPNSTQSQSQNQSQSQSQGRNNGIKTEVVVLD